MKFDRITFDPSIMGGQACIRGMRIPASVLVGQAAHGASFEEILREYPDLERADIQQALAYAAWLARDRGDAGVIQRGTTETTADWRERIVVNPKVLVGKPVIKGTRISVELVIDLVARGHTNDQIRGQYDQLSDEDIRACLGYVADVLRSERVHAP